MVESSNGNLGIQQAPTSGDGGARVGVGSGSGSGAQQQQQQQMSRASNIGSGSVTSSSLIASGSQQQQQQQQQQRDQQQQQQQQQSARTLRLFNSIIQPQNLDTPSAAQIISHGHVYQRISPPNSDRQQQIALNNNYNSMPFVAF